MTSDKELLRLMKTLSEDKYFIESQMVFIKIILEELVNREITRK